MVWSEVCRQDPQDILIFSKAANKCQTTRGTSLSLRKQCVRHLIDDVNESEKLYRNQVPNYKDDKTSLYACLQRNLGETRKKLISEAEKVKVEEIVMANFESAYRYR